jgi:STE24 endopeptidase
MTWLAPAIALSLVGVFLLNVIADWKNLRASRSGTPAELAGIYDEERYRASQRYLRARTRYGWCRGAVVLCATFLFWFCGGFAGLDLWVRAFGLGPIVTGLVYIGLLAALRSALAVPFGVYATFVIERRFGFNRTRWQTFFADGVKGTLLSIAIGLPLTAGVLALFEYAGSWAWVAAWAGVSAFSLLIQYVAPRWILPLFNTYTPLEEGPLRTAILEYARAAQFPLQQVFVVDGSRRSSKTNAFFTGFGPYRRAALFDTLVAAHPVSEIVAVLAHEVGHFRKRHILQFTALSILHTGWVFFLFSFLMSRPEFFQAFHVQPSVHAGLALLAIVYAPVDLAIGVATAALSRRNEYEADRFAVRTTGNGGALSKALRTLASHNLSNLTPHPFYVLLNYSHPPLYARLRAIDEEKRRLGP